MEKQELVKIYSMVDYVLTQVFHFAPHESNKSFYHKFIGAYATFGHITAKWVEQKVKITTTNGTSEELTMMVLRFHYYGIDKFVDFPKAQTQSLNFLNLPAEGLTESSAEEITKKLLPWLLEYESLALFMSNINYHCNLLIGEKIFGNMFEWSEQLKKDFYGKVVPEQLKDAVNVLLDNDCIEG